MEDTSHSPQVLQFGVFEVDLRAGKLRKHGLKVRIQDQPFQVLAMLLEHPGEVITREELRKRLWSDHTFVDFDHGVNTAINKIREALGDSAENPRFVETLPRRGYRFIAPVEGPERPSPRIRVRARHFWVAGLVLAAVLAVVVGLNVGGLRDRVLGIAPTPKIQSIAVLPLENLSGDPEQEYFADGMTEALITQLGQIRALRVISRTSVMQYKEKRKPLPEIARELNVDAIVEGTVRSSGDRVRITANLLHAPSDRHLWAETYERNLGDSLTLEGELARAIANEIRVKVTPQEHARLASGRPVNPEAYRLYLVGRYHFKRRTPAAFEKSVQLLQQALEKDPNCALAYAGLAESYGIMPFYRAALSKVVFPKAKAAARKALELDSSLAQAHAALGFVLLYWDWDWPAAESELKHAIELKPNYVVAHHWYAEYLNAIGRQEEAIAEIERAQELDPLSPLIYTIGGQIFYRARHYDRAIVECRKALEFDPNYGLAHHTLSWCYTQKRMYAEAVRELEEAARLYGTDLAQHIGSVYALAGRRGEALKPLERVRERSKRGEISPVYSAQFYIGLGEKQKALDLLEKGFEERDGEIVFLKSLPWLDPLRSDPRFQDLLRRMNFPE